MEFLNKIIRRNKFESFLVLAIFSSIIVLIISCIKYIYFGSINWDEPLQILGVEEHLNFAISSLKAEGKNYQEIVRNMEWYGIGLKFIYVAPMLLIKKVFGEESRFLQFSSLRGFALLIYLFSGVVFYYTSNFYQKRKSKILAFIYFTFPLLAGESYLNITDIPMAICFSFYSLLNGTIVLSEQNKIGIVKRAKKISDRKINSINNYKLFLYFSSVFMAALLINSKASMLAPVLIIETFLALYLIDKKGTIYKKALNFLQKIKYRLIYIFAITYLITPPAWLNPFKYYMEVIINFSKFGGNYGSRIAGIQLTTNTDSWNLFEYLWRWLQIKIPLIMILLIFIFFSYCLYQLIFKNERQHISILRSPLLTFYFLQLTITPSLAIIANSSTYNVLRHWCFIYPPLIIFSAFVIDNLLLNSRSEVFNKISKLAVGIFAVLGIADNVMLMPYSNLSFNTFGRRFVEEQNTDIDYWGYSAGELLRNDITKGYQVKSFAPPFRVGYRQKEFVHSPHHIKIENHKYPFVEAAHTRGGINYIKKNCKQLKSVKRNLLFRKKPLEMSVLGICPIYKGNHWKVWSSSNGQITVETIDSKNKFELPSSLNPWDFKRVNEKNSKDLNTLIMVFLKEEKFTIVEIELRKGEMNYKTLKVPLNQEIPEYIDNFLIPKTVVFEGWHDSMREWELGFKKSNHKPTVFYSNDLIQLISLDEQYVGIVCKRKNKRSYKTILKNQSKEFMHKPYGKSGDFSFTKAECIKDKNDNLKKIVLFDSAGDIVYRWEVDLNGVQTKSEKL